MNTNGNGPARHIVKVFRARNELARGTACFSMYSEHSDMPGGSLRRLGWAPLFLLLVVVGASFTGPLAAGAARPLEQGNRKEQPESKSQEPPVKADSAPTPA